MASVVGNAGAAAVLVFLLMEGQFGALLVGALFWAAVLLIVWLRRKHWDR